MNGEEERGPGFPYGEMDAEKWADEFERINPGVMDRGTMLAWFANAIMTGYDREKAAPDSGDRGQVVLTFGNDDGLGCSYRDMKPWKFWAAGKMCEALGDQMMMQAQMEQMQQQQQMQALLGRQGGLRGPRQ